MEEKRKDSIGCVGISVIAGIVLLLWFVGGFMGSGFTTQGGLENISSEIFGWFIFIIIAFVVYVIYKISNH